MVDIVDGFLRLHKVDPGAGGSEVYVRPEAIDAIEPTRRGCRVVTPKAEWLVAHSTEDLLATCAKFSSEAELIPEREEPARPSRTAEETGR